MLFGSILFNRAHHCEKAASGVLGATPGRGAPAARLAQGRGKQGDGTHPADVKAVYPKASIIGDNRVVFNIKGNAYRLVVRIDYPATSSMCGS